MTSGNANLEIEAAFNAYDRDRSGSITVDELENVMMQLGVKPTKLELKLFIQEADRDSQFTCLGACASS